MSKPSPVEVLRFIAQEESFERTLAAFPTLDRNDLASLMEHAARIYEARAASRKAQSPPPATESTAPEAAGEGKVQARVEGATPTKKAKRVEAGLHEKLRVYSDGAARGNPGPAGAGAVLIAPDGHVVERLGRFLGTNTNNYAEYMGLILGLERAHELGASEVEVFADSQLMIRQLEGAYKVKAENLKPLHREAQALLRRFDKVKLAHVPREQNLEADEMSNRAIDEEM